MKYNKTLKEMNITEKEYKRLIKKFFISEEKVKSIHDSCKENVEQVINNEALIFTQKVNFEFISYSNIVDENKEKINADVFKNEKEIYEITIYPKLIRELYYHSRFVISSKNIYKSIERTDENINILIDSIIMFWLDFIFFHEYSHVLFDHLSLDFIPESRLFELNPRKKSKLNNKDLSLMRTIESEADSKAAELAFARFYLSKNNLYEKLKIKATDEEKIFTYIYSLSLLFEWFNDMENKNNYKRTHPLAYERLFTCISFISYLEGKKITNKIQIKNISNITIFALLSYLIGKFNNKDEAINLLLKWFNSLSTHDKNRNEHINPNRSLLELMELK